MEDPPLAPVKLDGAVSYVGAASNRVVVASLFGQTWSSSSLPIFAGDMFRRLGGGVLAAEPEIVIDVPGDGGQGATPEHEGFPRIFAKAGETRCPARGMQR